MIILSGFLSGCQKPDLQKKFDGVEINKVIEDFSKTRLLYHLNAEQVPTNRQMIELILEERGFDSESFFKNLKTEREALDMSLFSNRS